MKTRPDEMAVYVAVVEAGGFTRAAARLRLTPSAVSRIIARLEERLGARLLNRTTRHVGTTEEGRAYFERCRLILADIEEADSAVAGAGTVVRGSLRVNVSVPFATHQLVPLIPAFLDRHPEIALELTLADRLVDQHEEAIDVAIRVGRAPATRTPTRIFARSRRVVCAAPAYLARKGTPDTPDDLAHHNCLNFTIDERLNAWPFRRDGEEETIAVRGNCAADNGETLLQLTRAGVGFMRVAEFIASADIAAGRLVPVLEDFHPGDEQLVYALALERTMTSARVRAFLDFLDENFLPVPPWQR